MRYVDGIMALIEFTEVGTNNYVKKQSLADGSSMLQRENLNSVSDANLKKYR